MSIVVDKADKVIHLRSLLRERFPEAHRVSAPASASALAPNLAAPTSSASLPEVAPPIHVPDFPLGLAAFDALDEGRGLSPGAFVEIVNRRLGGGTGALISGMVQAAATSERRYPLALVDGADSFDPASISDSPATAAAVCRQLLWVRCRHRIDHAVKTADLLLRDGNLPVVMLDLQLCRPRDVRQGVPGGMNTWYRLRSLGEKTGTIFLAFTAEPVIPAAPWRLELDHTWSLEALDRLPLTGDLRQEPVHHVLSRARLTTTSAAASSAAEKDTPAAGFAIAS
ncbi:MAG: hypothetical protein KDN20_13350 [Verrucomicrobiae bacterium]|nr:hypothetical protein [Verrucomicrobiae bacterium]